MVAITVMDLGAPMPAVAQEQVSNGAGDLIELTRPYRVRVRLKGTAPILLHRYNVESVAEKGKAAKGSEVKKTDDIESYVFRTEGGHIGGAGTWIGAAIREAGRSEPDPRSPRKSMRDLLRSIVIPVETVTPFLPESRAWDYLDRARVVVQRAAVTRTRPAMHRGWELVYHLDVTSAEYLPVPLLRKLLRNAGLYQGLADFRPTYGRFDIVGFEVVTLDDTLSESEVPA